MELNVSYIHNDLCVELEDDLRDFLAEPGFKEIDSGYDSDSGERELIKVCLKSLYDTIEVCI
jgi:hypothetical protein